MTKEDILKYRSKSWLIDYYEKALSLAEKKHHKKRLAEQHELIKKISDLKERLEEESYVVCDRGETIHKLQAWYDNLKKDNDSLNEDILKLQAELKESKKRDVWYMKPSDIDEVIQRNRHRVISYEELDKLQAEIQEIRRIITENVADEGLEALLQIKINELKKGSDV